jgi:molybdopterin converting factor subunit 1
LKVRALFFASYREIMGGAEFDVDLPDGATVSDLIALLRGRDDAASVLPTDPAVAVNRSYCASDALLTEGDEVAVIPPVAGG